MNDLDQTAFQAFAERFGRIERQIPSAPQLPAANALGRRRLARPAPVVGVAIVGLVLASVVGLAVIGGRLSPLPSPTAAAVSIPPDSAPPATVFDAYLRAVQAGDCQTARQLTDPLLLGSGFVDLCSVTHVTAFSIVGDPAVESPYRVRVQANVTITGIRGGISAGQIGALYWLQQETSGAWRIVDESLELRGPLPSFPAANAPPIVCDRTDGTIGNDLGVPIPAHLTCEAAIHAARAAIAGQVDPSGIAYLEFNFGVWCRSGVFCPLSTDDEGYVIVHGKGQVGDVLVQLHADANRLVTVDSVSLVSLPSPNPLGVATPYPRKTVVDSLSSVHRIYLTPLSESELTEVAIDRAAAIRAALGSRGIGVPGPRGSGEVAWTHTGFVYLADVTAFTLPAYGGVRPSPVPFPAYLVQVLAPPIPGFPGSNTALVLVDARTGALESTDGLCVGELCALQ